MFMQKRKKDLAEILMELKKSKTGDSKNITTSQIQIREMKIVVEIPQIEELIKEVRKLREEVSEFVKIIKSRIEEVEHEEEQESNITVVEESKNSEEQ